MQWLFEVEARVVLEIIPTEHVNAIGCVLHIQRSLINTDRV